MHDTADSAHQIKRREKHLLLLPHDVGEDQGQVVVLQDLRRTRQLEADLRTEDDLERQLKLLGVAGGKLVDVVGSLLVCLASHCRGSASIPATEDKTNRRE